MRIKYQIQGLMISEESTANEIEEWSDQLGRRVRRFEEPMTIMKDAINQWKEKNTIKNRKKEEGKFARRIEEGRKLTRRVKSYRDR